MNIESPFAKHNEDDFVVTEDMINRELPENVFTDPIVIVPEETKIKPLTDYTKKEAEEMLGYFDSYNTYIQRLKDDVESVIKAQFGVSTKHKEIFEDFMLKWIDINTEDFHRSEKRYYTLCSIINNTKSPHRITPQNIEKARLVPVSNFIRFKSGFHTCIFHQEKTPSMKYNEDTNTVKCFGCGKFADVITVYQTMNGVNFKQAVIDLCQQ